MITFGLGFGIHFQQQKQLWTSFFLQIQEEPDPPEVVQHTFFVDEVVPPVQHPDYTAPVIDHPGDYSNKQVFNATSKTM